MELKLYPHQQRLIDENPLNHILIWGTGAGKTIPPIASVNKTGERVLVVMPNMGGMLMRKWEKAVQDMAVDPSLWSFMTKEAFRKDFKTIPVYDFIVWDEAHALGNPKSQMHKALRAYIKVRKPKRVWLLTATPYLSDAPQSVYAYGQLFGRTDWKWLDFRNRFYREKYLGKRVIFEPKAGVEDELGALMREIGSSVKLQDCIDLPEHVFEEEVFDQTPEQKALAKELKEKETNPLTLYGKMHQIAQGVLLGNEYVADQTCHAFKNDRVLELAQLHPKLAVFSRYNAHLNQLANMLAEHDIPHAIINGETKDKPEVAALLERSPRAVALIQSATAMGYELPSFTAICYASCSFNYIDYVQSLGRFDRVNQEPTRRVVYHLMTAGSLDEDVMKALTKKESFSLALHLKDLGITTN